MPLFGALKMDGILAEFFGARAAPRNWLMPECVIRASYSEHTVRVYQAYRPEIAKPALEAGRFVPPFKMPTTSTKPSFNWMMYRSGYASKPGQEFVLGVDITRGIRVGATARRHFQLPVGIPCLTRGLEARR